ncbi:hypothetical protein ARMSODRAFT_978310 [Armillaria solidipes]|uniref:MYND-type domain-containing protein n=1 Tax=Armillaria solidipes TaxID=1076256 RepID=A0A2H3B3M9_9AGAR|nr:hypothetical protein ARMSODRAFT_978310 [Armillaria solidipes]
MPSWSHEFERDFHRISVEVLSLLLSHHHFIDALSSDTNLLTKYAPFLWLNPPSGKWFTSESQYEHIQSTVSTLGHVLPRPTSLPLTWQSRLVSHLEENRIKLIGLCVEGVAGTFAQFHEKKDHICHYNTLWGVTTVIHSMSAASSSTHMALLQNNSLRLVCQVFEFLTKHRRFTDAEFKIAITGLISVAAYFTWVMQHGHSYIYDLLGYQLMPLLLKATKHAVGEAEKYIMDVLHIMTSRLGYASILKRCRKAIPHAERMGLIEYLNSCDDIEEESLRTSWMDFRNIMLHRTNIFLKYIYTACGNEKSTYLQCSTKPKIAPAQLMCCSGCQFMLYCSHTCQKDDWKLGHRSLCKEIKRMKKDGISLPLSESDKTAMDIFAESFVNGYEDLETKWEVLKSQYIEEYGHDTEWPLVMCLDYRTRKQSPTLFVDSSRSFDDGSEMFDNLVSKAHAGLGTLVHWSLPNDGPDAFGKLELFEY